jgi:hypothetical protein
MTDFQDKQWQARAIWPPEPGHFAFRLVKKGWKVPSTIHHSDGLWRAEIDGVMCDPHADPALAARVADLWHGGVRISAAEYAWLNAVKTWALVHQPDHPACHPRKPIDHRLLAPLAT